MGFLQSIISGEKMAKVNLFISYSHKDSEGRQELEKWLQTLSDNGLVDTWCDQNIFAGADLEEKIFKKIDESNIIILLLSQNSVNHRLR
jgi:hypothetical protein